MADQFSCTLLLNSDLLLPRALLKFAHRSQTASLLSVQVTIASKIPWNNSEKQRFAPQTASRMFKSPRLMPFLGALLFETSVKGFLYSPVTILLRFFTLSVAQSPYVKLYNLFS